MLLFLYKLESECLTVLQDNKLDSSGNVKTYRIDAKGDIIGEWP